MRSCGDTARCSVAGSPNNVSNSRACRLQKLARNEKEILKEIYSGQSIENLELIDMTTALGGLRPPAVFSARHQHLLHAIDEIVAANQDKSIARSSADKQALSKAHQRQEHAIDLWRGAANELKRLGKGLHT